MSARTMLHTLIAVDVGNSRMKWGQFVEGQLIGTASLPLGDVAACEAQWRAWQTHHAPLTTRWCVASVNPDGSQPLIDWIRARGGAELLVLEHPSLLPLRVELDKPEAVGMDRLLDAVAVNARRPPGKPAIIADCGSAITVDAVSADGAFLGGTIAPGLGLAARALHEFTYWLPLIHVTEVPEPVGKSTPEAMRSGLFWGTVGAVSELIRQIAKKLGDSSAIYGTGGDAELLAPYLVPPIELVPELTLHGIYLSTQHVLSKR